MAAFYCSVCKKSIEEEKRHDGGTVNWGLKRNGQKVCLHCCADRDAEAMIRDGDSRGLPLYLNDVGRDAEVTNWPGSLRFSLNGLSRGGHNITGRRVDVWFNGPDGYVWHGVRYGHWTDIVHCKRTKTVVRHPGRAFYSDVPG